jgi:hypothetical protein
MKKGQKPKIEILRELKSDILEQYRSGATETEIYTALGVSKHTFTKFKNEIESEWQEIKKEVNRLVLAKARHALVERLSDKEVTEEITESTFDGEGNLIKKRVLVKKKTIPADTNAILQALKSLNPNTWNNLEFRRLEANIKDSSTAKEIADVLLSYKVSD